MGRRRIKELACPRECGFLPRSGFYRRITNQKNKNHGQNQECLSPNEDNRGRFDTEVGPHARL